eukprot:2400905-Pyramimonas_sp.AAC.1
MAGTEGAIGKCFECAEDTPGKAQTQQHTYTNCDVVCTKDGGDNLRPAQHPELTGADADAKTSKMIADMFVSLRGALARALITQVWLM